jgi:peptide/nickel transport system permease protein
MSIKAILSRPSLAAGSLIVLAFLTAAIVAPLIAPTPEGESPYIIPRAGFAPLPRPPGPDHPLGTLEGQSDVYYGLVWGVRVAFRIGLTITLGRAIAGILVGLLSGYYGGVVDSILMRLTDAFLAFPIMAAAMVMLALFGNVSDSLASGGRLLASDRVEQIIMLTLVAFGWMPYARLMRGNVLSEREEEYMQAARSTGVKHRRIIFRHLLPNVTQGLFVLVASDIGAMVALVAVFNFIGLTASSKGAVAADWGQMLSLARNWIIGSPANAFEYWYTYMPVSAALVLFSIGWNLIGDGLRDLLDPHSR